MMDIDNSQQPVLEYFFHGYKISTMVIYRSVLILIICIIIMLPLIRVPITIQSHGVVRPIAEKTEVKSLISETVEKVYVKENQFVQKDQPLIQLRNSLVTGQQSLLASQRELYRGNIADLTMLIYNKRPEHFRSSLYALDYISFHDQESELQNKLDKAIKEYERNLKLYQNDVLAEKDMDDIKQVVSLCENELKICRSNKLSKWQVELVQYTNLLKETEWNIKKQESENELYTIRAPVSGTIEQFSGIFPGSIVHSDQVIAVISPDSTLISEIYVNPNDIGLIHPKSQVTILVNAFNYTEWGYLTGIVKDISSDYILQGNVPVFRIRCNMDRNWLCLKNGTKGNLRKGMSVRAKFLIANRTLFQLLYENISDWIDPSEFNSI